MKLNRQEIQNLFRQFLGNWPQFLLIHVVVNVIIFTLLAPVATLLLHLAVRLSGDNALSDQDIFFFLLSPAGFISMLIMASVFCIILFLEHAALITVAGSPEISKPAPISQVLRFLLRRAPALFQLSLLVLLRVLLSLLPYLALLALVYVLLLGDYDINYYLAEKPAEWKLAIAMAVVVTAAAGFHLLRLFIGLVFSLPLMLFNGLRPAAALRESVAEARGHRLDIGAWLAGWLLLGLLLAVLISFLVSIAGQGLVSLAADSVQALILALAVVSLLGYLLSFTLTFFNATMLGLVVLKLFSDCGLRLETLSRPEARQLLYSKFSLSRWQLGWGLFAAFAVSLLAVHLLMGQLTMQDQTEIMAHRGASAAAPENTIAAIEAAIDSGAQWVEIDVQETMDGEVVVIHDSDLKKVGGSGLVVSRTTAHDLQQVDIGSWFAPHFSDQRVPTLAEVLLLCKDRIGVNIELKYYGREKQLEQRVVEIVEATGTVEQVMLMSLDYSGIKKMRSLRPDWELGLLSTVALGNLAGLDVDFLALNGQAASRHLIRSIQGKGKQIMVWTVNDPVGISNMVNRGVNVIITDEPALAVSVLEQRESLDSMQRILMHLADVFDQPSLYAEQ